MAFSFFGQLSKNSRSSVHKVALAVNLAILSAISLQSKEAPLTAIEIYDGPNGPAYVHITDVLLNGKIELRSCASVQRIDKSSYGKLPKVTLGPGTSLEYGKDGILILKAEGAASCVIPSNLKFEKSSPATPAELAARAVLQAKILSAGPDSNQPAPPLKPGVKIIFVAAPDAELAEFLRAERAATVPQWQDYLGRYVSSPHAGQAKQALASLLTLDGTDSLNAYRKSLADPDKSYSSLKNAKSRAGQALAVLPTFVGANKLEEETKTELGKIITEGQGELQKYQQALKARGPGYAHLTKANSLASALFEIDPHYAPSLAFETEANGESKSFDAKLKSAESLVAVKRFDEAFSAIAQFVGFGDEVPRIGAIVGAAYEFHYGRGQELATANNWETAAQEFQKALDLKKTEQVVASLKKAKAELEAQNDKHGAELAVQQSQALAASGQYIQAYELLSNLPSQQRALVAAELDHLNPSYVQAASETAKQLQQAHDPIRGLRDELEIERAHGYLRQAYALTNEPKLKDRQQDLADKLSDYYLQQAKRYMEKPLGSGAGLGWSCLEKALPYKGSNLEAIRDERTRAGAAYQMRSRLSIRVVFRDQTSRRDSAGFADQLSDALATGLENSGLPVRIIRPGENPAFEPNFQLFGDVLQHRKATVPTSKPKESKYRAGEQQVPNEAWNKANREHDSAQLDLQRDQAILQGASAHGKKKEIEEANRQVAAAQKRVEEASAKLDAIPKTLSVDIIKPYTYTEKTVEMGAVVQLQFRVNDFSGNPVENAAPIGKEEKRTFVVLENVKPDDTEGVKSEGTIPDEIQFFTDVENSALDSMLKAVKDSVSKFPDKIFEQARRKADSGDFEGAAESYILYLNSTPAEANPKREQAERFLAEQFNIRKAVSAGT